MSVTCDPNELANLARCFESCIPPGMHAALQAYLLCQIANNPAGATGGGQTGATKNYFALVTQTSTNIPTAVVLENSLGITPIYARTSAGIYTLNVSGQFVANKVLCLIGNNGTTIDKIVQIQRASTNFLGIRTYASGAAADGVLNETPVFIWLYP